VVSASGTVSRDQSDLFILEAEGALSISHTRGATELLLSVALEAVDALYTIHPQDKRLKILRPSILRAVRIATAALLLDENGFVEEVLALSRTLAEVVITACYLQSASEQELEAFSSFDIQKTYKSSETLEQFIDPKERISEEHRNELKAIVAQAGTRSRRKDTDKSWTTKSVFAMAQDVDATMSAKTHLFVHIKATAYEFGHPYVHGTYASFSSVRQWLVEGVFPSDARRETQRFQAVGGVFQCLATLCIYVNERFQLQFRQRIRDAAQLNECGDNV
jgi:hypothetical protein